MLHSEFFEPFETIDSGTKRVRSCNACNIDLIHTGLVKSIEFVANEIQSVIRKDIQANGDIEIVSGWMDSIFYPKQGDAVH